MISLISAALIMCFPLDADLRASESVAHAVELRVEAAVQDQAPDLGDEAAEELRVDRLLEDERLALEQPREPRAQVLSLALVEDDRGPELHAHAAARGVVERAVGGGDGR